VCKFLAIIPPKKEHNKTAAGVMGAVTVAATIKKGGQGLPNRPGVSIVKTH